MSCSRACSANRKANVATLRFLGVGEDFDFALGNSAYLLSGETNLLIDCGYTVPHRLCELHSDVDFIDALFLTHVHGGHTFGIPGLLTRWHVEGRKKPLRIIGGAGTRENVETLLRLAYPGELSRWCFPMEFTEGAASVALGNWRLSFAETAHSVPNLAIRVDLKEDRVGISGDGNFTDASRELFRECTVLAHEAFNLAAPTQTHAAAQEVVAFAEACPSIKTLALMHLKRGEERKKIVDWVGERTNTRVNVILPALGETIELR